VSLRRLIHRPEPLAGHIYFVIDVSLSMQGKRLRGATAGAKQLLHEAIRRNYTAGVIAFSGTGRIVCDLTQDVRTIDRALARLQVDETGTDMRTGIKVGHQNLRKRSGDRVLAIFSDGETRHPRGARWAADDAKRDGIRIITEFGGSADTRLMKKIASGPQLADDVRRPAKDDEIADRIGGLVQLLDDPGRPDDPEPDAPG